GNYLPAYRIPKSRQFDYPFRRQKSIPVQGFPMRRSFFTLALSACFLFSSQTLFADGSPQDKGAAASSADKKEPWKPEDVIYAESAQQMRISPDGQQLVWVKSTGDKEKDARVSNLFLSSLTADKTIALTRGSDNNGQPKWSPDGQLIAFISNRA